MVIVCSTGSCFIVGGVTDAILSIGRSPYFGNFVYKSAFTTKKRSKVKQLVTGSKNLNKVEVGKRKFLVHLLLFYID